ncbi:MAG: LL-diaminopimelate aminotransferase [Chloroflexi bacterium]|nr:LL-diaminopimelate aminotransferase [Chloroflexota bacterium]|tara:strand:- start:2660 stop:3838 length:1179 start_codon:yes stop_codon:yes gene_type:complete
MARISKRVEQLPPYLFVEISRKIAAKKAEGKQVITFGIGDPDIPTPDSVLKRLAETAYDAPNHRYPETEGLPEFRSEVAKWYKSRFDVTVDPATEIMSLIGAKEGIGHISLGLLDPGDIALEPDPAYPVYHVGTLFAGGESVKIPLSESTGWLPDFSKIPSDVAEKAKIIWLNYPNNPTGAVAPLSFFEEAVAFAKKYDIAILNDACYTEVYYDDYRPVSILEVPGAKDVSIEFHSLSKSYNMTGWRIGMAVGNQELIRALFLVKSNLDSGASQAIQHMGIAAMQLSDNEIQARNKQYQDRRDKVVETLQKIGLDVTPPKASLYVWAPVPKGHTSASFATAVLDDLDIVLTPGSSYGEFGEGYIRLSLTISDQDLDEGLRRLNTWTIPKGPG